LLSDDPERNPMRTVIFFALACLVTLGCNDSDSVAPESDPVASLPTQVRWTAYAQNPIIELGDLPPGQYWNDPCVLDVGPSYWMFMTTNTGTVGSSSVLPFRAVSVDGINWSLSPASPLLAAGSGGDFDELSCETPNVVFFGGEYHMYYSGIGAGNITGPIHIGHATSANGTTWTKDPNNPVLSPTGEPNDWNGIHVGEPGAAVVNSQVYLYVTAAGLRPSGEPVSKHVIALAKSVDGSSFGPLTPVLEPHATYPATSGFEGYSTPHAAVYNNRVHVFHDVAYMDGAEWTQVALHHAVSADGETGWSQDTNPIFTRHTFDWTEREIRSPAVLFDGSLLKLWFAGDDVIATQKLGIGYATADVNIYE
jgi:predicted GH43/DUF377 family glycosyl hydrolase